MSTLLVAAIHGIPEIVTGDDLSVLLADALAAESSLGGIQDGDIIVVTSKVVSKAEGRQVMDSDREAAITAETVRHVASRTHAGGVTRIVENRQGLVLAAAGVDNSNTPEGTVLLLPDDPDASARLMCSALRKRFGTALGVIVSDTLGRPWREGQTDAAIGAAGVKVIDDHRGALDDHDNRLAASITAVGDEIAAAADLVKGKTKGRPVALVRGLEHLVCDVLDEPKWGNTARSLVRPAAQDMFRLGSDEAYAQGFADGQGAAAMDEPAQLSVPE